MLFFVNACDSQYVAVLTNVMTMDIRTLDEASMDTLELVSLIKFLLRIIASSFR